jgi:RNA 2',3'-cyclic 3'-phosphodiesterase
VRAFVAIEVPGAEPARNAPEHLTLRFLGALAADDVPRAVAALRGVAAESGPFDLDLEGVGAFPNVHDPRVVWVGVTRGRESVVRLAARVSQALVPVAGPPDRSAFVPHLTLFRVRGEPDRERARELLDGRRPAPPPRQVRVEAFYLKESRLERGGAIHRTLERFPLSGPDPSR